MAQISRRLTIKKEIPIENSKELLNTMDLALAEFYCKQNDFVKGLQLYREVIPKLNEGEGLAAMPTYMDFALKYALQMTSEGRWTEAIEIYRDIMKYTSYPIIIFKHIGLCMKAIGNADAAIKFLKKFEEISPDKENVYEYLADITYNEIKDNLKAIEYYEKAVEESGNRANVNIYNMLGHLYSSCYQDKFKDKQIEYLKRACELAPNNRVVVKNLAYVYGKFDDIENADKNYARLMRLNPTHSDLHAYGAYLVKHRRFAEGFKYLLHRFLKEDLESYKSFPQLFFSKKRKRWVPTINLTGKTVLIHFEQGFGDTIMFIRYVEQVKKLCAKAILAVQEPLIPLFKDSGIDIEMHSDREAERLSYDYLLALMDAPLLCGTEPDTIPSPEGYLSVPKDKIEKYRNTYIGYDTTFKIGIAFEGTLGGKATNRDIPLEYLYPLMKIPGVEVYSFQVDDLDNQMEYVPKELNFKRLGRTFRDWDDTACAMNCMDLMVTSDNGVLNLAGALGIKTFGLYNRLSEWRWFQTEGEDVGWYKSVKPYVCPTTGAWDIPINRIIEDIYKLMAEKNKRIEAKAGELIPVEILQPESVKDSETAKVPAKSVKAKKPANKTSNNKKSAKETKAVKTSTSKKLIPKKK